MKAGGWSWRLALLIGLGEVDGALASVGARGMSEGLRSLRRSLATNQMQPPPPPPPRYSPRPVAERALKAIHYREEGEKFNVWVAWLNLENAYGAPDPAEAVMALFRRALQVWGGAGGRASCQCVGGLAEEGV